MRVYPLVVLTLATVVLAVAVFGARDGSPECVTCHSGPAPKGSFRIELPRLSLKAPAVVNGSSSFQLLVLLEHDGDYEIVGPRCIVTYTEGGEGPVIVGVELQAAGKGYSAVVRVNATKGPVEVDVEVHMVLHYDHPDPGEEDIAPYSVASSVRVEVAGAGVGPDVTEPDPERSPGAQAIIALTVTALAVPFLPRRRTGRP